MSGLGACKQCGEWIYWRQEEAPSDGRTRNVPYDQPSYETLHWATCPNQDYIRIGRTAERVTRCKDCQHRIYWETTSRGRRRPMDVYRDEDSLEFVADGYCHFDTCTAKRSSAYTNNWRAQDARASSYRAAGSSHNGQVRPTDLYRLNLYLPDLGLRWPCQQQDVVSAFRALALRHHPDMGGRAVDFIRVKRAYDALKELVPA